MAKHLLIAGLLANAVIGVFSAGDPAWQKFQDFAEKYNKTYASESETRKRFNIFKENLRRIAHHNAKGEEKHDVNKFADLKPEEFKKQYMGRTQKPKVTLKPWKPHASLDLAHALANSKNWCDEGACTPVKNQYQCGSCWAFGGTECLESEYKITYGALNVLSPEQVTSCDSNDGGCAGGNAINAWFYVNSVGGQVSESYYPYTAGQNGTCTQQACTPACKQFPKSEELEDIGDDIGYCVSCPSQGVPRNEANMLKRIQEGTMSIAVDAEHFWQTYTGGVVKSGCGTTLDHNVQITGYNADGNYWIVRNSWGPDWGENGFIYVEYGANNCGIAEEASYPVASKVSAVTVV